VLLLLLGMREGELDCQEGAAGEEQDFEHGVRDKGGGSVGLRCGKEEEKKRRGK
jgi:hypothetical protein